MLPLLLQSAAVAVPRSSSVSAAHSRVGGLLVVITVTPKWHDQKVEGCFCPLPNFGLFAPLPSLRKPSCRSDNTDSSWTRVRLRLRQKSVDGQETCFCLLAKSSRWWMLQTANASSSSSFSSPASSSSSCSPLSSVSLFNQCCMKLHVVFSGFMRADV